MARRARNLPWWRQSIEIRGTRLHLAGLDSAWMACGDEDRDRLLLGRYQLNQTVETPGGRRRPLADSPTASSLGLPRPIRCVTPPRAVHQHCDLLLRGHLHVPLLCACCRRTRDAAAWSWLQAASTRRADTPTPFSGWSCRRGQAGPRAISRLAARRLDHLPRPAGLSRRPPEFDLPRCRPTPVAGRPAAAEIPPDYLAWLRTQCQYRAVRSGYSKGPRRHPEPCLVPALTQSRLPSVRLPRRSGSR